MSQIHPPGGLKLIICIVPMALVALAWREWLPYLWPLVVICVVLALFQVMLSVV